jgi:hypothetical protein
MTIDRRLLAGGLGLILAVAACGGSSTGSSGATTAPAASAAAATSGPSVAAPTEAPVPTDVPAASSDTSTGVAPSLVPGAAADLEATLPDEAGGIKFQKTSFDGSSLGGAAMGIDAGSLAPLLAKYGKSVSDVRVAIAAPANSSGTDTAMVIALQIKGIPADQLLGVTGTDASTLTKTTIGGKSVLSAGAGGFSVVVYPKDDVLYEVLLANPTVTEAIVQKLP